MKLKNILAGASAALLLAGAGVAQANSAQSLSLKNAPRAASVAGESNEAAGGFLIPAIALAAVVAGIIIIADDGDSDSN